MLKNIYLISSTSQYLHLAKVLSQINITKNKAAGGGCKNESFFNNVFSWGRFHMSRHMLLLNPSVIFKRLFFPIEYKNHPNFRKTFCSHAVNPRQTRTSFCVSLIAPARTSNTAPQSSGME